MSFLLVVTFYSWLMRFIPSGETLTLLFHFAGEQLSIIDAVIVTTCSSKDAPKSIIIAHTIKMKLQFSFLFVFLHNKCTYFL